MNLLNYLINFSHQKYFSNQGNTDIVATIKPCKILVVVYVSLFLKAIFLKKKIILIYILFR